MDTVSDGSRSFRYSPSPGQEITLRRPRAKAGPYEQVTIREVATHTLSNQLFQYARLELVQTLDATQPPALGAVDAVLTAKAEIFPGFSDTQAAMKKPALIRTLGSGGVEPFEVWLVADEEFTPNHDYPGEKPALRTIVVFQQTEEIPPRAAPNGAPILDDPPVLDSEVPRRVVLFETEDTLLPAPPRGTADARPAGDVRPRWERLFEGVYAVGVRDAAGGKADKLNKLTRLTGELQEFFVLVLQYTKATDAEEAPWVAPRGPIAAIKVTKIDAATESILPKCVVSVLHAPVREAGDPTRFSLCGYAQLDADDFSPVAPSAGPEGNKGSTVAWTRVANLQTLDRLPGTSTPSPEDRAAYSYDVAFYGPGGELVPIPEEVV